MSVFRLLSYLLVLSFGFIVTGCSEQQSTVKNSSDSSLSSDVLGKSTLDDAAVAADFEKLALQVVFWRRGIESKKESLLLAFNDEEKQGLQQGIDALLSRGSGVTVEQLEMAINVYQSSNGDLNDKVMDAMMLVAAGALIADDELKAKASPYLDEIQKSLLTKQGIQRVEERLGKLYNEVSLYQDASAVSQDFTFLNKLFEYSQQAAIKDAIAEAGTWNINGFINADQPTRAVIKKRIQTLSDYYLERYDQPNVLKTLSEGQRLNVWRMRGSRYHVENLDVGNVLPSLAFESVGGGGTNTDSYRGKYLLLDFWTTTCGPCKRAMPDKGKLVEEFDSDAFQLISIACDEDIEEIHLYREEEYAMEWGVWHFPANTEHGESLAIRAYPTYMLISPAGEILKKGNDFKAMARMVRGKLP